MLCVVMQHVSRAAIEKANRKGDFIEFKIDCEKEYKKCLLLRNFCKNPLVVSGNFPEIKKLLALSPSYLDLPHYRATKYFPSLKKTHPHLIQICSYHNFEKTQESFSFLLNCPSDIYKIATFANTITDGMRLLLLAKQANRPLIPIAMGSLGQYTRILAPTIKAPFTYAPLEKSQKTALGQLTIDELDSIYFYRSLSEKTAVYGLIGDPVEQSISHYTHNFAFKKLKVDAVYLKFKVDKRELSLFLRIASELNWKGLSVTMPLKKERGVTAINTLLQQRKKWVGKNTDGKGALNLLEKYGSVQGKKILILGAGGVGEAIAREAVQRGAHVILLNRTLDKARILMEQLGCEGGELSQFSQFSKAGYDILIQATSLGMAGKKESPVLLEDLLEKKIVMEVVSTAKPTLFMEYAALKKCKVISGRSLFFAQAIEQFYWWLN